jgi:1,4-alpha-glucan branching enzyme
MSITKKFLKGKPVCKVTFKADATLVGEATTVALVGDFNDWSLDSTPMKASKAGDFSASLDLEAGKEYAFRYVANGTEWLNDTEADKYVVSEFGSENAVIVL